MQTVRLISFYWPFHCFSTGAWIYKFSLYHKMSWDMWRGRPFFTLFLRWGLTMNLGENSWKVLRLCVAPLFVIIANFDLSLWKNISDHSDSDFCRHHMATCVLSVLLCCFLWLASSVMKSRWGMHFTPCISITRVWAFELICFPSFMCLSRFLTSSRQQSSKISRMSSCCRGQI